MGEGLRLLMTADQEEGSQGESPGADQDPGQGDLKGLGLDPEVREADLDLAAGRRVAPEASLDPSLRAKIGPNQGPNPDLSLEASLDPNLEVSLDQNQEANLGQDRPLRTSLVQEAALVQ